ncbi:hypothetical protein PC111_g21876 [Phytophthora cactorum]|nr:hypothetical protein PC111_g21876 [Phytophthora cactorum]KAG3130554.1 hypothetical protein C6341_g23700 [Phytophthora cactorum]
MAPSRSLDDRYRYIRPGAYPIGTEGLDLVLGPDDALEFYTQAANVSTRVAYVMSESTYRMPLLYVLFFTSRMKRELLHPPHPSSDRTTGVLIWSLPPHVLMRHVRLRVEHVVSSREARDHAHYSHDDCSLLHRRTPPMVRTTTQLTTRVVDDLGADDDDSVDWTGYSAEEDEVLEDDDLNCTAPGEDTAQYGATDSGDKAALDDIDTGKEAAIIPKVLEVDEATYAPDAAALKIAHEIRFEEQFLENIGGKEAGWLETPGQDLRKIMVVDGVVRRDGLVINTKFHAPM